MRDGVRNTIPYAIGARSELDSTGRVHLRGHPGRRWSARYGSTLDEAGGHGESTSPPAAPRTGEAPAGHLPARGSRRRLGGRVLVVDSVYTSRLSVIRIGSRGRSVARAASGAAGVLLRAGPPAQRRSVRPGRLRRPTLGAWARRPCRDARRSGTACGTVESADLVAHAVRAGDRRGAEPVPGYPKRPVPRDEDAAKLLKKRTLTNLYNARPQWLADAHEALDAAVVAAYGWSADIPGEDAPREVAGTEHRFVSDAAQRASDVA